MKNGKTLVHRRKFNKAIVSGTCLLVAIVLVLLIVQSPSWPEESLRPEFNEFYTRTQYSTGETSDILASYIILHLPRQNLVWYGLQRTNYNVPGVSMGGRYSEEYHTFGGYFAPRGKFSYQYDYFRLTNSLAQQTEVLGGEITYRLAAPLAGGLAYYSSTYPFYRVSQYTARILYFPSSSVTSNTKISFTETSDARRGLAVQEKLTWTPSSAFSIQVRGAVGTRIHYVDNDIASFYTQYQELTSSYGAQVNWTFDRRGQATLCLAYNRDAFNGYSTQGYTGGLKVRF